MSNILILRRFYKLKTKNVDIRFQKMQEAKTLRFKLHAETV